MDIVNNKSNIKTKTLCVIPARGGSKGIPKKNIKLFNGFPLIYYTIKTALACPAIDKVVVSTDDVEIADIARSYGAEVPFLRPKELAQDNSPTIDSIRHAVKFFDDLNINYENIIILEPTSPLRDVKDIEEAILKINDPKVDTVVGVVEYDIDLSDLMILKENDFIEPFVKVDKLTYRRQDSPELVLLNGAFYVVKREILLNPKVKMFNPYGENSFLRTKVVVMPKEKSVEIDDLTQFKIAEEMYSKNKINNTINNTKGESNMDASLKKYSYNKSNELFLRAKESVPAQCHTLSHGPTQYVSNVSPKFIERGDGCYVWDVDGNKFLDLAPGGFPAILGYNDKEFNEAVIRQLGKGTLFPMPSILEVETAEKLIECIPCAERVKFAKNGSDVTAMAVRLARGVTNRKKVATGGYHGFQDWFIGTTSRTRGIPEEVRNLTLPFEYNNIESLKKIFKENPNEIAAVILEPVQLSAPKDDFLNKVKELTHQNGAILIFDEVITGFRFALGGAQEYFGVTPDLASFGKALGNGMPISALVGKKELMDQFSFEGVFFSSTFGGECTSLAASCAVIDILKKRNVIPHIWKMGDMLRDGFNAAAKRVGIEKYVFCIGFAPWTDVEVDTNGLNITELEFKSLFQQECMKRGMLAGLYHALTWAHKEEDIKLALNIYEEAMIAFKKYIQSGNPKSFLEGDAMKPVFRKKS